MGDRCYVELSIYGKLQTEEDYDDLVEAIEAENMQWTTDDVRGGIDPAMAKAMVDGVLELHKDECNYADISELEAILQGLKLPYIFHNEAGGEYGAGTKRWTPDEGEGSVDSGVGGAVFSITDINEVVKRLGSADAAIEELRERVRLSTSSEGLPKFDLPDEVKRELGLDMLAKIAGVPTQQEQRP